jgi:outer membrane lipoprotein-sorting protein
VIVRLSLVSLSLATALAAAASGAARADDAAKVAALVDKADMIYRGTTSAAVFDMEIKTSSYTRGYKIVSWDDSRKGDHALVKILGPALWRGYGTLKLGDTLELYDPKSNHVTVVGQSMLGDSWMGSHFSNDDLVKETHLGRDYDVTIEKSEPGEAGPLKGTRQVLRLTPKPTAPVAWGRIEYELLESGSTVLPVRADYYRKAKDTKAVRSIAFGDVKAIGGRTVPTTMTVTVAKKPGEYTKITYTALKFDVSIPGDKFTEQALRR